MTQKFVPLTPPVVIPGSSYFVVMGKVNDHYHVQVRRGNTVLSIVPIHTLDVSEIAAIVYNEIKIPMFNMFSVMKAVGRLLNLLESGTPYVPSSQETESLPEATKSDVSISITPETEEVQEKNEISVTKEEPVEFAVEKKKLEISKLTLEEKWKRAVAHLNLIFGLVTTILRDQYGDSAVRSFWDSYSEQLAKIWKASAAASFESKIVNIVHWAEVIGINIVTVDFNSEKFLGEVPKCLFKERSEALKDLGINLSFDFPCTLCWMQFSKVSEILGLSFKLDKKDDRCIFQLTKQPPAIRL